MLVRIIGKKGRERLYMFIYLISIISKTTLLSILMGLYPTTKGDAILNGFDIKTQREQVYMSIGIWMI